VIANSSTVAALNGIHIVTEQANAPQVNPVQGGVCTISAGSSDTAGTLQIDGFDPVFPNLRTISMIAFRSPYATPPAVLLTTELPLFSLTLVNPVQLQSVGANSFTIANNNEDAATVHYHVIGTQAHA
jgi:hypothetical protein